MVSVTLARRVAIGLIAMLLQTVAEAHAVNDAMGGFIAGARHPVSGVDHLLAMLAVGVWGVVIGGACVWLLPVVFPLVMALGAIAGIVRLPLPPIEFGIAASLIALGSAVAMTWRPGVMLAVATVALFAIFHGYAHGQELLSGTAALPYCVGFVCTTGLLHAVGIAIGQITRVPRGMLGVRCVGIGMATWGMVLVVNLVTGP